MLNELGKSSSFGDIWPAFVDRGSAGFTSPSGRAFAGRSIAFGIAAAVAAWSILWHWVTTPPPTTTGRQPHRGFSVPKPDICSQSVYSARTYRSDLRNPRFQTHFLTLNPGWGLGLKQKQVVGLSLNSPLTLSGTHGQVSGTCRWILLTYRCFSALMCTLWARLSHLSMRYSLVDTL